MVERYTSQSLEEALPAQPRFGYAAGPAHGRLRQGPIWQHFALDRWHRQRSERATQSGRLERRRPRQYAGQRRKCPRLRRTSRPPGANPARRAVATQRNTHHLASMLCRLPRRASLARSGAVGECNHSPTRRLRYLHRQRSELVVEDDSDIADLVCLGLRREGFDVMSAAMARQSCVPPSTRART